MSEIPTRYACYENYSVSSMGQFVKFLDYEQAASERDSSTAEITRLKEQLRQFHAGEIVSPAGDHALSKEVAHLKDDEIKFLKSEMEEMKAKLDYVHSMGLRFGMMESSDKPEPYLAHVWDENSGHERMFREWSASIGWEHHLKKVDAQLAAVTKERDEAKAARTSDRKTVLLKAAFDLLKQHQEAHFVESAMETIVTYDEAECDGHCLMEDIEAELGLKGE